MLEIIRFVNYKQFKRTAKISMCIHQDIIKDMTRNPYKFLKDDYHFRTDSGTKIRLSDIAKKIIRDDSFIFDVDFYISTTSKAKIRHFKISKDSIKIL